MTPHEQEVLRQNFLEAMEGFQQAITLPLLLDLDIEARLLGSGVLFTHGGRHFILTAAHLFDPPFGEAHLTRLSSPDVRTLAPPTTLGRFTLTISDRTPYDYDTAVIELFDESKIGRLRQHWRFLTIDQIAFPTSDILFSLGGFPGQLVRKSKGANHGPMVVVRARRLKKIPQGADDVNENIDIFCEYAKEGEIRTLNKEMPTPKLQGTSGGSLLQFVPEQRKLWSAEKTMKLVGIQSSGADTRSWFRVKNWHAVLNAFEKHDPDLAGVIRDHLLPPVYKSAPNPRKRPRQRRRRPKRPQAVTMRKTDPTSGRTHPSRPGRQRPRRKK